LLLADIVRLGEFRFDFVVVVATSSDYTVDGEA